MLTNVMSSVREFRAAGGYAEWERRTTTPLAVLAAVFLASLLVDLLWRNPPGSVTVALRISDYVIWAVFLVDYLSRLYLARRRWHFVRTHPLDLIVVIIPTARPLRLLKLARLGAVLGVLARRSRRTPHVRIAAAVTGSAVILLFVAAAAMFDAERAAPGSTIHSFGDALWWAATTVSTVGYGDRVPVTVEGRLVAVALMVVGISVLGVVTASVAAWFVDQLRDVREAERREDTTLTEVMAELRAIREENARLHAKVDQLAGGPTR
ncbi:MAG: voltage-gated potassium channel [Frankiales bacterium]|jgi:voltage-gated potassium channel|nr:voltage-gated potassium channel [Frankiales bacterium]